MNFSDIINIALPKGRLLNSTYNIFAKAGYECASILESNRRSIFENQEKKVRFFLVRPRDVAFFVEQGIADIGVIGKDILLEYNPNVQELLDLKIGNCNMVIAALNDFKEDFRKTLRVATKFENITRNYYSSLGRDIKIIYLNGSVEIAPNLGFSDVIVDIVETGATLKENNLCVIENIFSISARLISNKESYKIKNKIIEKIVKDLYMVK